MNHFKQFSIIAFLFSSACTDNEHKLQSGTVSVLSNNNSSVVRSRYSYKELSKQFDLIVDFTRYTNLDSYATKTFVTDKRGVLLDSMISGTRFYWGDVFSSDTNVRSYATHVNEQAEVIDDYFGDIIVADLNFDGLDDIAIVKETSNGGVFYNYYSQNSNKKFTPNQFLNDSVSSFPQEIDAKTKTIITYNRSGCCHLIKHIYVLQKNIWSEKKQELLIVGTAK